LRVLLSFENFAAFGGTESYTLTVATELERLGNCHAEVENGVLELPLQ
jgi:hypothetical protein